MRDSLLVDPDQFLLPRFVVFEGVDGTGKTTLARALAQYYRTVAPARPLYSGSFPGVLPGSLGEWVYRLHHDQNPEGLQSSDIAAPALQLLHVAAHVDAILSRIGPTFTVGGNVILDRYWWSTYAYARCQVASDYAWALVGAERPFWSPLPPPTVVYLTRTESLKLDEVDTVRHAELSSYYREVIEDEERNGISIHELTNNDGLGDAWRLLLQALNLPYRDMIGYGKL